MSADPMERACLSADDVRAIVRDEMRTDRERIRQLGARLDGVCAVVTKIRRSLGALANALRE
jgi:hypothetical protein